MIRVLCEDEQFWIELVRVIGGQLDVERCLDVSELRKGLHSADCSVLFVSTPVSPALRDFVRELSAYESGAATWPVVIVEEKEFALSCVEAHRRIRQTVIGAAEISDMLMNALAQERARGLLDRLLRDLRAARGMSEDLRKALLYVITTDEPPRTVRELALAQGLSDGALHAAWRRGWAGKRTTATLGEFLDIVFVLRVRSRTSGRIPVSKAAEELGDNCRRLRTRVQRFKELWPARGDIPGWISLATRLGGMASVS